jgi:RimJ/RimL family protein N-acetyltransferase
MHTERLVLRNWYERDRDLFHRINSDDRVMRFFPFRRDRAESDAFLDRIRADIDERGYGFCAAERIVDGACIGFVGVHPTRMEPVFPPGTIEIGWRLAPEFWGRGYVTEAGNAWLDFAFQKLGVDEVVSFCVIDNLASEAVMRRLGMRREPGRDFDHPGIPPSHPKLLRHVLCAMSRADWEQKRKAA